MSSLLKMHGPKNKWEIFVSDESCWENQNTHFYIQ